ncbi:hypothetical protein Godav_006992, partial [Gossypium davidsonii]|nr:hypothetical protein [Gossypium davidsonii]
KTVVPKAVNEVKLISSGKILENDKTVGQCKVPFGEVAVLRVLSFLQLRLTCLLKLTSGYPAVLLALVNDATG